ncbi:hypothetical protein BT63DRAFT_453332 [Microthyrium microscopicum]|uniref:Uncharacterized protein n=1 Tax=Microthyrium microscopicum TaxID=703497 RepID=A0A6A6UHC9_9PEZI|nr:hypothetical protein BT63DRAFT_453332 [Microthyrium microscopicum]
MEDGQGRFAERDAVYEKYLHLSQQSLRLKFSLSHKASSSDSPLSRQTSTRSNSHSPTLSPIDEATPALYGASLLSVADDLSALMEVNQQIKATLTELLNCPSVKLDRGYRAWVQERLMEAEHEIRQQRRRRSSNDRRMS